MNAVTGSAPRIFLTPTHTHDRFLSVGAGVAPVGKINFVWRYIDIIDD